MKPLIVANWKCNPTSQKEAKKLFKSIKKGTKLQKKIEVVICPPFVYLPILIASAQGGLAFGSQDCFWEEKGAFTGEVSALMLKNLGVGYVILGHSERRKYLDETDEQINKKIKKVLGLKLKPILCIGESKKQRDAGKKSKVLEFQIKEDLKGVSKKDVKNVIIAYEPIWAIGTGNNCSIKETMNSVFSIRKVIQKLYGKKIGDNLRILYGGSVNRKNAGGYVKEARTNGLLVGGASLDADDFIKIVKSI